MEETVLKRILPHSMEAEQSVIGSMLMDREAIVVASELITGEVKVTLDPKYGYLVQTRIIDGHKYILISADSGLEVNGISVSIDE